VSAVRSGAAPAPSLDDGLKAQLIEGSDHHAMRTGAPVRIAW